MKYQMKFTAEAKNQEEALEKFWDYIDDFGIEPQDFLPVQEATNE